MDKVVTVNIAITLEESLYLMQRLSKLPFDEVAMLLPKLKQQTDASVAAHQVAERKLSETKAAA